MANKFQYNTGQIIDSSAIGNVEFAICMTVAWLVPRLVTRQRLYHRSLRRSPHWVNEHVSPDDVAAAQLEIEALDPRDRGGYMDEDPGLRVACRVVDRAMWISIAASVLFYVAAAITLGLLTAGLDFRTSYILVGISNFVASFYIFLLSYSAPQWLGVYASVYSDGRRIALGANLKALSTVRTEFMLETCCCGNALNTLLKEKQSMCGKDVESMLECLDLLFNVS